MKGGTVLRLAFLLVLTAILCVSPAVADEPPITAQAAGVVPFTYQGLLRTSNGPVNGTCAFRFSLWQGSDPAALQVGVSQEILNVVVSNGLFTVQLNSGGEFLDAVQGLPDLWLQSEVKCAGDADYTALSPRTKLAPAPYAISLLPNTGPIHSMADSTLYLSPHSVVVRHNETDAAKVAVTPLENGAALIQSKTATGYMFFSLPVPAFGTLFGTTVYVKSLEVCYEAHGAPIGTTAVIKGPILSSYETYLIEVATRSSAAAACYTVNAGEPRKAIDNSTWAQVNVNYGGPGAYLVIGSVKVTLTENATG